MKAERLVALLGRPLTTVESENRELYLKIAYERLEDLTCLNLEEETVDRIYNVRKGYDTVFTDLFTQVNSVTADGQEIAVTDYTAYQWDRQNAKWYNSIVLKDCHLYKEVTINADYGVCSPELSLLVAKLFALVSSMNKGNGNVKSKRVEDFYITFNDNTVYDQFLIDNAATISKYSICGIGQVQSGRTGRNWYGYGI